MADKTEKLIIEPKKSNYKVLIIIGVIIIAVLIYFWRQDVEFKKCFDMGKIGGTWLTDRCRAILAK